jgi:hypothetical protein
MRTMLSCGGGCGGGDAKGPKSGGRLTLKKPGRKTTRWSSRPNLRKLAFTWAWETA